jgi:hypothetical protein
MSSFEYLTTNALTAYPFKDGRAINLGQPIPADAFLDAACTIYAEGVERVYIRFMAFGSSGLRLVLAAVNGEDLADFVIPAEELVSHLARADKSFYGFSNNNLGVKLVFGKGIEELAALGGGGEYIPEETEFSPGALNFALPVVKSLSFETAGEPVHSYYAEEEVELQEGTNNNLGYEPTQTMLLNVRRGLGKGLHDPCGDPTITDVLSIDEINPDSAGNFFLRLGDCYASKVLTGDDLTYYRLTSGEYTNFQAHDGGEVVNYDLFQETQAEHGIVLQNNCKPKCPTENLNAFAEYLNRVKDGAAELYKTVYNPNETCGIGATNGNILSVASFCEDLPAGVLSGSCSSGFVKYFHEGRIIRFYVNSITLIERVIAEVIEETTIVLDSPLPSDLSSVPFKVMDLGLKDRLDLEIGKHNTGAASKNSPYTELTYSTVEAYNADKNYGTFITSVTVIYNPGITPLNFETYWTANELVELIPSSIKVKSSEGIIDYSATTGTVACKDYAVFEVIFFIPCSGDPENPNVGEVTLGVRNRDTGEDLENSPRAVVARSANCVAVSGGIIYSTALEGTPYSYTFNVAGAISYTVTGDLPPWLSTSAVPGAETGNLYGSPDGAESASYTLSVAIAAEGGSIIKTFVLDYIARPRISQPTEEELIIIRPPDITTRTYTQGAPLLQVTASNKPKALEYTGYPPGLTATNSGLIGKINLPQGTELPRDYTITIYAVNEAGRIPTPTTVTLRLIGDVLEAPPIVSGTPYSWSLPENPNVSSMLVIAGLPSSGWLRFENGTFSGQSDSTVATTLRLVVRQNLLAGGYATVSVFIPFVAKPSITSPPEGANITLYTPDYKNQDGEATLFTENSPLVRVVGTNSPTNYALVDSPVIQDLGLSITSSGAIIGQIPDTAAAGVYSIGVLASNAAGSSLPITFSITLPENPEAITTTALQGAPFCYRILGLRAGQQLSYEGTFPEWLKTNSSINSSCHLTAAAPTGQASDSYTVVVKILEFGGTTRRKINLSYVASPVVTFPRPGEEIKVISSNFASTVYTSSFPLIKFKYSNSVTQVTAVGLPAGLSILGDAIVGTITAEGRYQIRLNFQNPSGITSVNIVLTVSASAMISYAYEDTPYCYKYSGFGDIQANSYSYNQTLPNWLTFNASSEAECNISGTSSEDTNATYPLELVAVDQDTEIQKTQALQLVYIARPRIIFPTPQLVFVVSPPDFNGVVYTAASPLFRVAATNSPTSFKAVGFPQNTLSIDSQGNVIGTTGNTVTNGNIPVVITATNSAGVSESVTIQVNFTRTVRTTQLLTTESSVCLDVDNDDGASNITISGLPNWLSYTEGTSGTCSISGNIPEAITTSTRYNILYTKTYPYGGVNRSAAIIELVAPPVLTSPYSGSDNTKRNQYLIAPPDYLNRSYTAGAPLLTLAATNNPTSYSVQGLPAGLFVDSQGRVVGTTEAAPGIYTVTATATNAAGTTNPAIFSILIRDTIPTINTFEGASLCQKISSADNPIRYTRNGALPAGLQFSGNPSVSCSIYGTPTTASPSGTYPIDITSSYTGGSSTATLEIVHLLKPVITLSGSTFNFLPSQYTDVLYTEEAPLLAVPATNNPTSYSATGLPSGLSITCYGNIIGVVSPNTDARKFTVTITAANAAGVSAKKVITLDFSKIAATITWNTPTPITYGTALSSTQLNATSSEPGTITYSRIAGTILPAGNAAIVATFTPTDSIDYAIVTKTVTLVVNKIVPTIVWNTPEAITYGELLSSAQLNATTSGVGTLVYSPAAGTRPGGGTATLRVTFSPADVLNVEVVTATVQLVVNKADQSILNAPTFTDRPAILSGNNSFVTIQPYPTASSTLPVTTTVTGEATYSSSTNRITSTGSPGAVVVTFSQAGNANYNAATSIVRTFNFT